MTVRIAVSVFGKDKPGIVAGVAKALFNAGCNIEDSSMTLLESEFAVILIASAPNSLKISVADKSLLDFTKKAGLTYAIRKLSKNETAVEKVHLPYIVSVYGGDKPGIVYQVSNFLAKNNINIINLGTRRTLKGTKAVYIMNLQTDIPSIHKALEIKKEFAALSAKLDVVISMNPLETPSL